MQELTFPQRAHRHLCLCPKGQVSKHCPLRYARQTSLPLFTTAVLTSLFLLDFSTCKQVHSFIRFPFKSSLPTLQCCRPVVGCTVVGRVQAGQQSEKMRSLLAHAPPLTPSKNEQIHHSTAPQWPSNIATPISNRRRVFLDTADVILFHASV